MSDLRSRSGRSSAPVAGVRHGRQPRSRAWRGVMALLGITVCVAVVSGASVAAIAAFSVTDKIKANAVDIGKKGAPAIPSIGEFDGGFNLMLVGVDNDPDQSSAAYGKRGGATLNDVNILLHVSADHKSATAVSIPRDMVVPIPSCDRTDGKGKTAAASGLPINVAYSYGGLKCVVDTVSKLSGLDIPFAGLITFDGVVNLSTVVGGVTVCVDKPIKDPYTGLNIPAGSSTLEGAQAAAFVRSRHGVGDGSDLGRISSQQVFMSALVRKLKDDGTLGDVSKLYGIAQAASTSMKLSTSLASLDTMVSLARAMKDIPLEKVVFVQYPGSTGGSGIYAGKVQPNVSVASKMWSALKSDQAIALDSSAVGANGGSELDPNAAAPTTPTTTPPSGSASASPDDTGSGTVISGLKGQDAAQQTCAKAYVG